MHYILLNMYMYMYSSNIYMYIHVCICYSQAASDSSDYYFYYKLLGNDITSEVFKMASFKPERASIRIKSTRDNLAALLATQGDLKVRFVH